MRGPLLRKVEGSPGSVLALQRPEAPDHGFESGERLSNKPWLSVTGDEEGLVHLVHEDSEFFGGKRGEIREGYCIGHRDAEHSGFE